VFEGQGGQKKDYNQDGRDLVGIFSKVTVLSNEMEVLAWKHRSESPVIHAMLSQSDDVDGSRVLMEMMPRSFWAEDLHYLDFFTADSREMLRFVYV